MRDRPLPGTDPDDRRIDRLVTALGRRRSIVGGAVSAVLMLLAFVASDLMRSWSDDVDRAESLGLAMAQVLGEHTRVAVGSVDALLMAVQARLDAPTAPSPQEVVSQTMARHPFLRALHVVGADGRVIASSMPEALGVAVADRGYFRHHRDVGDDDLYIGRPAIGRATGDPFLSMSRRLGGETFRGVVMASVDPAYFHGFYDSLPFVGDERVTLYDLVGQRLIGAGHADTDVLASKVAAAPAGVLRSLSAFEGDDVAVYARISTLPLVLTVSLPRDQVLADWIAGATRTVVGSLLLVGALGAVAVLGARAFRRGEQVLTARLARRAAEQAHAAKSELLAQTSHDLRTPLSAMVLTLRAMRDGTPGDASQQRRLDTLDGCVQSMLGMVSGVLDLERLEAGVLDVAQAPFVPGTALAFVAMVMRHGAESKGLTLEVRRDPAADEPLMGDAERVRQVLINLVGNAVKFTDHGRIVVGTEAIGSDTGTVAVRFFVEDSGIGMEPSLSESLFEPYVQGSEGRRRGGAGLGLSICRKLVDAMGGRLDVCSTPGQGSRFWFTLVLEKAGPQAPTVIPAPSPSVPAAQDAPLRILVAEDDDAHRTLFAATLGAWGHAVQVVGDGLKAVERATAEAFDLLILDVGLPGLGGPEVARRLSAVGRAPRVLVLTADTTAVLTEPMRRSGVSAVLIKPVDWDLLRAHVTGIPATTA